MNAKLSSKLIEAEAKLNREFDGAVQTAARIRDGAVAEAWQDYRTAYGKAVASHEAALVKARKEIEARAPKLIDVKHVASVYSGSGTFETCACGCKGKYTYASSFTKWASKDRGSTVTPDEVNDRTVNLIVNKINLAFAGLLDNVVETMKGKDGHWVGAVIGQRVYVAHFAH